MHDGPSFDELKGKRLGAVERGILLSAPSPGLTGALILKAPSGRRPEQESVRRAARKLESLRLIRVAKVREGTRAYDPRRHEPVYWEGEFYVPIDKTRRHSVPRLVCWKTVFGNALVGAYREEMNDRRSIRWREETYDRVARSASLSPVTEAAWQAAKSAASSLLGGYPPATEEGRIFVPGDFGPGELQRWSLSSRVAAARNPRAGSARILEEARKLMGSNLSSEDLRREVPEQEDSPPGITSEPKAFPDSFEHAGQRLVQDQTRRR